MLKIRVPTEVNRSHQVHSGYFTFSHFPEMAHGRATLSYDNSLLTIQRAILRALGKLNCRRVKTLVSIADIAGSFEGEMSFEVGVAERDSFNYLDDEEEEKALHMLDSIGPCSTIDFFMIVRYEVRDGRRHSIRSDSYAIRFTFLEHHVDIEIFHEKGIRRLALDELIMILAESIEREFDIAPHKALRIEKIRTA